MVSKLVKRINGFDSPSNCDQKTIISVYWILTAAYFFVLMFCMEQHGLWRNIFLGVHCILVLLVIYLWYRVESTNPEDLKENVANFILCFPAKAVKSHYCASCKKYVLGMDHHCTWLNTCVGTKNYVPFFLLINCGNIQFGLEFFVGLFIEVLWLHSNEREK